MNKHGVSSIVHNNKTESGPRYCERCFRRGRVVSLGEMTREQYVRAYHPKLEDARVIRHAYPCPKCRKSAVLVSP